MACSSCDKHELNADGTTTGWWANASGMEKLLAVGGMIAAGYFALKLFKVVK